jgi:hypothetical protein
LEDINDSELLQRHKEIIKNLLHIASEHRDIIPSVTTLSSWYWYRKEHQTRVEMALRGIDAPAPKNLNTHEDATRPVCPVGIPNGTKLLFKYGDFKHMKDMINFGSVKFSPPQTFKDINDGQGRRDIEYEKASYTRGSSVKMTTLDGRKVPNIGSLKKCYGGPFYHMACFSCEWQHTMFSDFNANSCVMITDPQEFSRRIERARGNLYAGWYFQDNPIQYYDPYEVYKNTYIDAAMTKDFKFSYQKEYRFIFSNHADSQKPDWQILQIGNCSDIMQLFDIYGNRIYLQQAQSQQDH